MAQELKEPLWEEIYERLSRQGLRIRSIWIADSAPQAESAAINAENLGFERAFRHVYQPIRPKLTLS